MWPTLAVFGASASGSQISSSIGTSALGREAGLGRESTDLAPLAAASQLVSAVCADPVDAVVCRFVSGLGYCAPGEPVFRWE
jgi:hypothetical protein